ncbi:MAG: putative Ig domain-containing protein, partial [Microbacterium sp.]
IDDFSGSTAGPRVVTPLPRPGESTQAPGTFAEAGGSATMTMGGSGNRPGGVELGYALPHLDLTSQGNNTQFFLAFSSIARSGVEAWETAAQVSISLTGGGIVGTYSTAISTTGPFNIVLNFSCVSSPVCFSPQPDFTDVTEVEVTFLYPQSHEAAANTTTIVLDSINTTPTGGTVPPPATATLASPDDPSYGPSGTTLDFPLTFVAGGTATAVYSSTTAGPLTAADVVVGGTAGGVSDYSVTPDGTGYIVRVGPLTSAGTVDVSVPAGVAVDSWAQDTLASSPVSIDFVVPVPPAFTSPVPPDATLGASYSHTFVAGGIPPASYSVTAGAVPIGLTLSSAGVLSGTPTVGGNYSFTVTAANVAGTASTATTISVGQAPAITSSAMGSWTAGSPGTFTVTASGLPAPAITVSGGLPAGITFADNGDGTGTLAGTPLAVAAGTSPLTFTATNAFGSTMQDFSLSIATAPAFAGPLDVELVTGTPASYTLTTIGSPAPAISASGALPAGLTLIDNGDGTATLSGTPTAPGTTGVVLTAQNAGGTATGVLNIVVRQAAAITSADSAIVIVGTAGSFTVTATGSPTPALTATGPLPDGMTFTDNGDGTATLAGAPAARMGGDYPLELTATVEGLPPVTQAFTLKVKQEPIFLSAETATFVAGQPGTFTVVTEAVPVAWLDLVGTLPAGLTFTDNGDGTATIAGTPSMTAVGTHAVTINATNDLVDPPQTLTIVVLAPAAVPAASAPGTAALPATGDEIPWWLAVTAGGLLLAGAGLRFTGRRARAS